MLPKNSIIILLMLFSIQLYSQKVKTTNDYQLVYIALSENDNTNYQKLISKLKNINSQLIGKNLNCVLYFTKGMISFSTDRLDEWDQVYRLINGNSIIHLNADDEINKLLEVFKKYEFSEIGNKNNLFSKYKGIVWNIFIGNGYWQEENNQNILGALVTICGISNSTNFKLNIYHDSQEKIQNLSTENALGKFFSFISEKNTTILKY